MCVYVVRSQGLHAQEKVQLQTKIKAACRGSVGVWRTHLVDIMWLYVR